MFLRDSTSITIFFLKGNHTAGSATIGAMLWCNSLVGQTRPTLLSVIISSGKSNKSINIIFDYCSPAGKSRNTKSSVQVENIKNHLDFSTACLQHYGFFDIMLVDYRELQKIIENYKKKKKYLMH